MINIFLSRSLALSLYIYIYIYTWSSSLHLSFAPGFGGRCVSIFDTCCSSPHHLRRPTTYSLVPHPTFKGPIGALIW